MLRPPGSSSSSTSRSTPGSGRASGRKSHAGGEPSPDDVIRGLQRLPPNKRCCDCQSKLPSCVNLTIGSFVCISCAGIHRELTHKVKGVGHSSFTADEAALMKGTDNDRVNALYLARYNPSHERMKAPVDNSDMQHLRAWIHRKYKDKLWYQRDGSGGAAASFGQPTVAQIPPKPQPQPQPEVDLFGGGTGGGGDAGWDAFGGSSSRAGGATSTSAAATPSPAFHADFGSFSQQQQQPPPPADAFPAEFGSSQTQQQVLQQPQPQQQEQPAFQASFANFQPQAAQQPPLAQHQPPHPSIPSAPFQATFGPPPQSQGGGFVATFSPPHALSQPQQQPQPSSLPQVTSATFAANFPPSHQQPPAAMTGSAGLLQMASAAASPSSGAPSSLQSRASVAKDVVQSSADAISCMSMSPGGFMAPGPPPTAAAAAAPALPETQSKTGGANSRPKSGDATYKTGQKVYYKSASYAGEAQVVKVHLDDDLVPYYTILVDGKEKQTDDAHLSAAVRKNAGKREEIDKIVSSMSESQLDQVLAFVRQLQGGSAASPSLPSSRPVPHSTPARSSTGPVATAPAGGWNGGIPSPIPVAPPTVASVNPPTQQALQQPQQQQQQQQQQQHQQQQQSASLTAAAPAPSQTWDPTQQASTMQMQQNPIMHPAMMQNLMMAQYQMAMQQQLLQQQQNQQQQQQQPGTTHFSAQSPQQQQHSGATTITAQGSMVSQGQIHSAPTPMPQQTAMGLPLSGGGGGGGFVGIPSPTATVGGHQAAAAPSTAAAGMIPAPPLASGLPQPHPHLNQAPALNGTSGAPPNSQQAPLSPKGNPFDIY